MASVSSSGFALTNTRITVEGAESNLVFYNLVAHQALADVNSFSFIWRQPGGRASFSSYVQFYKKYLAKDVTIHIGNSISIKGIITSITCVEADDLGVHYEIQGKGPFAKLDESPDCCTFLKRTIKEIFTALNTAGLPLTLTPNNTSKLHYTVQYNQTTFEFFRMMAIRHGEWLYDNGSELVLGPPQKRASASLQMDVDLNNVSLSAYATSSAVRSSAFDQRKGDELQLNTPASSDGSELMQASLKGGDTVFAKQTNGISIPHVITSELLSNVNNLRKKSLAAATVSISAHSYCDGIKLGSRINVKDVNGGSAGDYIVTDIHHFCSSNNSYENQFSAIPADVEVPPYTDPLLYPRCKAQPALVVNNVDADGLDRIQVKFPWQGSAEPPWINVLTPHAGKGKGIRFLPEVGEEVMIGFIDDNAEKPFYMGAIHTEKNKSEDPEKGNDLKIVGTRSGRRLEIDDEMGLLHLSDNKKDAQPRNVVHFERKDQTVSAMLKSGKSDSTYSAVELTNGESMSVTIYSGGSAVTEIKMTSSDKKILIHATGDVEIKADQDMTLSAANISISALQEVKIEGKSGVSIKGTKVAVESNSTMDIKGVMTTVEGSAKVDLKATGIASIAGAMVKIN